MKTQKQHLTLARLIARGGDGYPITARGVLARVRREGGLRARPARLAPADYAIGYSLSQWLDRGAVGSAHAPIKKEPLILSGWRLEPILDDCAASAAYEAARREYPRRQHTHYGCSTVWGPEYKTRIECSTYGGYPRTDQYGDYQSCVGVSRSGRTMIHVVGWRLVRRVIAPRGARWDFDANGLRLVRGCGDYHPKPAELRARDLIGRCQRGIIASGRLIRAERKKAKIADALIRRAERAGARVILGDSLAAGNCEAGSRAWCVRHGLSPAVAHRPSVILSLAGEGADRVRVCAAVRYALERHTRLTSAGAELIYPAAA